MKTPRQRKPKNISWSSLRKLAVEASCDPRTITRVLNGLPVRTMAADRARKVLEHAGLLSSSVKSNTGGK